MGPSIFKAESDTFTPANGTLLRTLTLILTVAAPLFTSCMREQLSLQTSYLNRSQLASFHVGTPDPALQQPLLGERLLVQWALPCTMRTYVDLQIILSIRFKNGSEIKKEIVIDKLDGWYEYFLLGQEAVDTGGIVTYKADLLGDGELLDTWIHQLWVEKITF